MDSKTCTDSATFLARLRAELDTDRLAATALATVNATAYASTTGTSASEDVGIGVARTTALLLSGLFASATDPPVDCAPLELLGAQRRRQGVAREAVREAIDLVARVAVEHLLETGRRIPASGAVATEAYLSLWHRLPTVAARIETALLAGFDHEATTARSGRARSQAVVIDRLVDARWQSAEQLVRDAASFGIDLTQPHELWLVGSIGDTGWNSAAVAEVLGKAQVGAVVGPERTRPVEHLVVLVPANALRNGEARERVATAISEASTAAVRSEAIAQATGFAPIYELMAALLDILPVATTWPGVVSLASLRYHAFLLAVPLEDRADFVRETLGPAFEEPDADVLFEALDALFETPHGVKGAAQRLLVHPNTVLRRVKRFESLLGLDLRRPLDAHRAFSALRLRGVRRPDALAEAPR